MRSVVIVLFVLLFTCPTLVLTALRFTSKWKLCPGTSGEGRTLGKCTLPLTLFAASKLALEAKNPSRVPSKVSLSVTLVRLVSPILVMLIINLASWVTFTVKRLSRVLLIVMLGSPAMVTESASFAVAGFRNWSIAVVTVALFAVGTGLAFNELKFKRMVKNWLGCISPSALWLKVRLVQSKSPVSLLAELGVKLAAVKPSADPLNTSVRFMKVKLVMPVLLITIRNCTDWLLLEGLAVKRVLSRVTLGTGAVGSMVSLASVTL